MSKTTSYLFFFFFLFAFFFLPVVSASSLSRVSMEVEGGFVVSGGTSRYVRRDVMMDSQLFFEALTSDIACKGKRVRGVRIFFKASRYNIDTTFSPFLRM